MINHLNLRTKSNSSIFLITILFVSLIVPMLTSLSIVNAQEEAGISLKWENESTPVVQKVYL